ncbi:hypothetical protein AVEN_73934-1 [Araneus ventricosus]|uniref:Uncharacterized protein n=1 Tax=Araneus ventricosus TaxID=182803 RepID=A0A4Y2T2Q7_ARAVE|nr:hypothetical protein AVEN_73934-1 [Araneus ventricosus]
MRRQRFILSCKILRKCVLFCARTINQRIYTSALAISGKERKIAATQSKPTHFSEVLTSLVGSTEVQQTVLAISPKRSMSLPERFRFLSSAIGYDLLIIRYVVIQMYL